MFSSDAEGLENDMETEVLPTQVGNVDEQSDVLEILVSFLCNCDYEAISDTILGRTGNGLCFHCQFLLLITSPLCYFACINMLSLFAHS